MNNSDERDYAEESANRAELTNPDQLDPDDINLIEPPARFEWSCRDEGCDEGRALVVAIGIGKDTGRMYAVCAGCLADTVVNNESQMFYGNGGDWLNMPSESVAWHGTHILSADALRDLYEGTEDA